MGGGNNRRQKPLNPRRVGGGVHLEGRTWGRTGVARGRAVGTVGTLKTQGKNQFPVFFKYDTTGDSALNE